MKNSEQMDSMSRDLVSQFKFHHLVTMIPTCNATKRWQFLDVLRPIRYLLIIRKKSVLRWQLKTRMFCKYTTLLYIVVTSL